MDDETLKEIAKRLQPPADTPLPPQAFDTLVAIERSRLRREQMERAS